ncbi:MAG: hypothetical protein GTO40_00285 [Deltaproteobacteria bacterium]|nr:hypothetical protein [Deltaproteobacteria bacterium]
MKLFLLIAIIALGGSVGIIGCGSSPATRYYLLAPLAEVDQVRKIAEKGENPAIGIGPVQFPKYLDRPQIVTRTNRNQIDIADFDQWAEPLQDNFTQVIAENLSLLFPGERIVVFPWGRSTILKQQVLIEVVRFEGKLGGETLLTTRWSLLDTQTNQLLSRKVSHFSAASNGSGFNGTVSAMNQTLEELSREIAAALKAASR